MARQKPTAAVALKVRGFARIQLVNARTGAIEADRTVRNAVTANGFHDDFGKIDPLHESTQNVGHLSLKLFFDPFYLLLQAAEDVTLASTFYE